MRGICNVFQQRGWCSGIAVEHTELAISIWFDDEFYDSDETRGLRSSDFTAKSWRSGCFKRDMPISF
jgi:hypothetical protein